MRSPSVLAGLTLVAGGLGAVALPSGPSSAAVDPAQLIERWCSGPATTDPCLESASHNGVAMAAGTGPYRVEMTGPLALDHTDYVQWQVVDSSGAATLPPGDTWSVTLDMGTMKPRYTEGYSADTTVTRSDDGDGTFHVTISGTSVRMAESCTDDYPPVCENPTPFTATVDWRGVSGAFSGEVQDMDRDTPDAGDDSWRNGYDRYQNLDGVGDPFFEATSDGGYRLTFDTYNAATYDDDGVPGTAPKTFHGSFGMRLPANFMRKRFGVPDPDTLPLASFVLTTSGSGADGTWTITRTGGTFHVSVDGITYPDPVTARSLARAASTTQVRTLRVKRGVITPYAPRDVSAKRTAAHRGRVSYAAARARGARPTGYTVRCVDLAGTHVVSATSSASPTVVTGLRSGKAYDCRVRARSKVGPGAWSVKVRLPARS